MAEKEKNCGTMKDHSIRFPDEIWKKIGGMLDAADVKNSNEFVREAVSFYIEYLSRPDSFRFITPALESVIDGKIKDSEGRINRMLFKLAVDVAFLSEIIGINYEYSYDDLTAWRNECINTVRATNGSLSIIDSMTKEKGDQ